MARMWRATGLMCSSWLAICSALLVQGQLPAAGGPTNAFTTLSEIPEFSMFCAALKGSELHMTVGNALFTGTIFVPSNLAILNTSTALNIPADRLLSGTAAELRRIVAYHIVPDTAYFVSAYYQPNLQDRQRLATLLPDELLLVDRTSAPGRVLLRGHMKPNEKVFPITPPPASIAGITQGDIKAGKAVIHIIDALLMPPENASGADIPVGRLPNPGAAGGAEAVDSATATLSNPTMQLPTGAKPLPVAAAKPAAAGATAMPGMVPVMPAAVNPASAGAATAAAGAAADLAQSAGATAAAAPAVEEPAAEDAESLAVAGDVANDKAADPVDSL